MTAFQDKDDHIGEIRRRNPPPKPAPKEAP